MHRLQFKKTLLAFILVLPGCSDSSSDTDPVVEETPTTDSGSDSSTAVPSESELTAFLAAGSYLQWPSQDAVNDSPIHGKVKTFLNPTLDESQKAGNSQHPLGSIAVKELYQSDGITIKGYALEQKISADSGGSSWLWYEDLNTGDTKVDFYGVGLSTCTGCHSSGSDYVRVSL